MRSRRESAPRTPHRHRLWPVAVVLVAFYSPFLVARLSEHDAYWLVHVGRQMLEANDSSTVITPALGWQSEVGYDGQYYYALAVDPTHAPDYMPASPGPAYYSSRVLYPLLARALAVGQAGAVPITMLVLNLLAVGAGTLAIATWLRRRRMSPWFSLLYGLYPGLIFAVFRDLTEPLAFGLVAVSAVVFDRRSRSALTTSAVLLALAALARETTLAFALGLAFALVVPEQSGATIRGIKWRRALAFFAACSVPALLWRIVVARLVGGSAREPGDGLRSIVPFHGILDYWPWDSQHVLIATSVVLPTLIGLASLPWLLRRPAARGSAILFALNAAAFVVFVPRIAEVDYGAAGRIAVGAVLASIICLPSWPRRGFSLVYTASVVLLWSLPWYAFMSAALDIPGLTLITS